MSPEDAYVVRIIRSHTDFGLNDNLYPSIVRDEGGPRNERQSIHLCRDYVHDFLCPHANPFYHDRSEGSAFREYSNPS